LLAAMLGVQRGLDVHILDRTSDGPKPVLARDLGATYHNVTLDTMPCDFDVVLECTASSSLALDAVKHTAPGGIVCLLGVSAPGESQPVDVGALNLDIVLGNRVIFGSV